MLLIVSFAAVLQFYYPFTNLPINDSAREGLKAMTTWIVHWAGLAGTLYFMFVVFIVALLLFIRVVFLIRYRSPAHRDSSKVEERRAAKRVRIRELEAAGKRRSRRSVLIEVDIDCALSVAWILNDAIFNRPEGTAIVDGAKAIIIHCPVRARRGQIRLQGDEESRVGVPTQGMAQVPSMKEGFEEKLIEIDDTVEKFEDRMSKEEHTEIDN
ncbi:hypothetical protein K435DRAFT_876109 [Dendrothele bispora CBS 962.96]|uniref:Uncharacterized protein n=1 Tax=Dendrothele bispora (strain CBS 962.96) TaxID=1314807 RepID=A0A4S8KSV2_DENBC|nr:hypothetical protein K435DRAFT_876109 [Dendrothele bispora CBS 962.96]